MALVAASCLFLAAMVHAAVTDAMRHRALNLPLLILTVAFVPLAWWAGLGWTEIVSSVVAALLIIVIGFAGFCAGWFGGGEVKLAGVATLWIGAGLVVPLILLSALFAGTLTGLSALLRRWQRVPPAEVRAIPANPGIVLAALALFASSQWFGS